MRVVLWLMVRKASAAIDYYQEVFRASVHDRTEYPGWGVSSARLCFEGGEFWICRSPRFAPSGSEPSYGSVLPMVIVDDPDALFDRFRAKGALVMKPLEDRVGWRSGRVLDPFGQYWDIAKPLG